MKYVRMLGCALLECEFCTGKLDSSLTCCEPDCFADMAAHWSFTTPERLVRARVLAALGTVFVPENDVEDVIIGRSAAAA